MVNKPTNSTKAETNRKLAGAKARQVTFRYEAPAAGTVFVAGEFSRWEPKPLKQRKDGTWWANLSLQPGAYQYKFVVDGRWEEDPQALRRVNNEYGTYNSVCEVA